MEVRGYTSLSPFGPRRSTAPIAPGTPTGAASPPVAGSTHRLLDGTKAPRESSVPPPSRSRPPKQGRYLLSATTPTGVIIARSTDIGVFGQARSAADAWS